MHVKAKSEVLGSRLIATSIAPGFSHEIQLRIHAGIVVPGHIANQFIAARSKMQCYPADGSRLESIASTIWQSIPSPHAR
jgi:hypothetical protein